ncbi:MAG TPA: AI-2E family transporter [Planctomycetota bacterium]|nr:AI-2E family transporter [Planctomycetota bacterium]
MSNGDTQRLTPAEALPGVGTHVSWHEFLRRAVGVLTLASLFALLFLFLYHAVHVVLLVLSGVLLAIFLRSLAALISRWTRMPMTWSLITAIVWLLFLTAGTAWVLTPQLTEQARILARELPASVQSLKGYLEATSWGQLLLQQIPDLENLQPELTRFWSQTAGAVSTLLLVIADIAIIVIVGLYLAFEPRIYVEGMVRLTPPDRRQRARSILEEINYTMRWWLVGRFISMFVIGVFSGVGFWLLGVPLALTLGIIAAIFTFVPNIGPIFSAVPAVLLALVQGPAVALYVLILIVAIQALEGYLLTPLIQRRTISMPPALVLAAQVLMGLTLGFLGLFLATPITAMVVILVQRVYLEGVLKERRA